MKKYKVFLGFDGFIDNILRPVKRKSRDQTIPFRKMSEFADYLKEKNNTSGSIDMELLEEKIGGNMPIVAHALGNLGCETICVGALGEKRIHPVFCQMSKNCKLVPICAPGFCNSIEFTESKLMLAVNTNIDRLDFHRIIERVPQEKLVYYLEESDAVAFLNWGELIHSNDIWRGFLTDILPRCHFTNCKILLVDFSDFSNRADEEVAEMLVLLEGLAEYFDITVSVNENELRLLAAKLRLSIKQQGDITDLMVAVAKRFPSKHFVIHMLKSTYYVVENRAFEIEKKVINQPKIITGGGDNFNAGLLMGLLKEERIEEAVNLGARLSCLYVEGIDPIALERLEKLE